jgi:hypothetical protein
VAERLLAISDEYKMYKVGAALDLSDRHLWPWKTVLDRTHVTPIVPIVPSAFGYDILFGKSWLF